MAAETFFGRWSRRKHEAAQADVVPVDVAPAPAVAPAVVPTNAQDDLPAPTLEQVAVLEQDADFRPFVARGVDEGVRRAAMKKLFTDPHFNVMDGLDIYIDDYSKSDPIPAAMLLAMNHAKDLLDPLGTIARENAKRGLLTAADVQAQLEQAPEGHQAAPEEHQAAPQEHHEQPGQGVPESAIAPTEPVAPEPAAAPSLLDPIDPADRQEDHEQPNQSL
jgi:hypothetical protein